MIDEHIFREKLQLFNYKLLMTASPMSENDYEELSSTINELLGTSFSVIYLYDQWKNSFFLKAKSMQHNRILLNQTVYDSAKTYWEAIMAEQTVEIDCNELFTISPVDVDFQQIPLRPENGPIGMVVVGLETGKSISRDVLQILKVEVEKLLQYTFSFVQKQKNEEKNQVLFDMTSRFLKVTSKTEIFTEIITSLQKIYPEFSFCLHLSQEYETNTDLPVKLLDSTIGIHDFSSIAFMTGEIQIENQEQEDTTYVYAPLIGQQGVYGVLQISIPKLVYVPKEEIDFIGKFAATAGKAIESTTLYQNSKHLVADLKMINDLIHQLNSNLNLTEITKIIRKQITLLCEPEEIGFIYNIQENTNLFETLEGSTSFFDSVEGKTLIKFLLHEVEAHQEAIFSGEFNSKYEELPYHSVMAIPLKNGGTINGMVIILHRNPYAFSFEQFKLLQSILRHSTLAIMNTILTEKLKKAASTDYLTQLFSRNYLDKQIMEHMESDELGTLILFDIDDFKKVNDTYGHYIGDEIIKQVAEIILSSIDDRDVAARWGGEELAVYLPNTELEEGVHVARNIGNQVEIFTEPRVTLSAGVSSWSNNKKDSPKSFFIRADRALYEAKSFGKNCVVKYGEEISQEEVLK
jgi:two-component system, cell cycle response regulator